MAHLAPYIFTHFVLARFAPKVLHSKLTAAFLVYDLRGEICQMYSRVVSFQLRVPEIQRHWNAVSIHTLILETGIRLLAELVIGALVAHLVSFGTRTAVLVLGSELESGTHSGAARLGFDTGVESCNKHVYHTRRKNLLRERKIYSETERENISMINAGMTCQFYCANAVARDGKNNRTK